MSSDCWRSYLYAPGNNAKLLERVFTAGADAVVLDLEDAVPPADKDNARAAVAAAIARRAGLAEPAVFVRVNGLHSGRCRDDVEAVAGPGLAGIRLPKVETAEQAREVASWLGGTALLDCAIETAAGVLAAGTIAAADSVHALVFGAVDFAADIDALLTPSGRESFHARSQLVLASRAAEIAPPVDAPHVWLDDDDGLRAAAREARTLGFGGKSAIHPRQLPAIHDAFTPSPDEVDRARAILEHYHRAAAAGTGALKLDDGSFVDLPVAERARRTLTLAERQR